MKRPRGLRRKQQVRIDLRHKERRLWEKHGKEEEKILEDGKI
jgi:hypothetical protein